MIKPQFVQEEEIVAQLVNAFKERQSFANNINALGDVTPNQWADELDGAGCALARRVLEVIEHIDIELHDGEYCTPQTIINAVSKTLKLE